MEFFDNNPDFVVPESKFKEIKTFVRNGLQDFSISRLKSKMPWGIDVPGDPQQVMFVWFDALINYISAIGWPDDKKKFDKWWPVVQFAGKDNLRQQSAIWQAMLLSAGLPASKQIFIHGFITVNGQKISKSLGNTINPIELTNKYGVDAARYFLLAKIHPYDDSDFTYEKLKDVYNSDLANGLGNLVSRVAKLCEKSGFGLIPAKKQKFNREIISEIGQFRFDKALEILWQKMSALDKFINEEKLWEQAGNKLKSSLTKCVETIRSIAYCLVPFLPETAEKIEKQFAGPKIKAKRPLFPRLS